LEEVNIMDEQSYRRLGQISEHYESRGRGPATISSGKHDHGGASYGVYQLSTRSGTLKEYLDQSVYGMQFEGLTQGSSAFDAKWRELGTHDPDFASDQQEFIKKQLFEPQVQKLKDQGLDLSARGPAVQEALWSTSVQLRNLTPGIFAKGLEEQFGSRYKLSELSDREIVSAVQDYKISHTEQLFAHSQSLWPALRSRANDEKADLLSLADGKFSGYATSSSTHRDHPSLPNHLTHSLKQGDQGEGVLELQIKLRQLGYTDGSANALAPDGRFGPATEHAVASFQQDHHLVVDGKVGNKTMTAIDHHLALQAQRGQAAQPLLDDPRHPDHKLFRRARDHVHMLDEQFNRTPDQRSDNLAAALTVNAKKQGLTDIDALRLSEDHSKAIVFDHYDSLLRRVAAVEIVPAMNQSMVQSTRALSEVNAVHAQQMKEQQLPIVSQAHPAAGQRLEGPVM
jgi:hypothetical protein